MEMQIPKERLKNNIEADDGICPNCDGTGTFEQRSDGMCIDVTCGCQFEQEQE